MRRSPRALVVAIVLVTGTIAAARQTATEQTISLSLPNKPGSLKFGVLGDFGTGKPQQNQLAEQMAKTHGAFRFDLMLLVGDNVQGNERPQDFVLKFERPYKPLLDAGVLFRAALGHDDSREQRNYKPFNMNGELYYSFKASAERVRFFALETTYLESKQILWLEKELKSSNDDWKIVFFHHPLYSSARRHGSNTTLRDTLERLFVAHNVSVVFSGHDHVYERLKPQKDITYFVTGSGGELSQGDLNPSSQITAKGFDAEQVFLIAEIIGDEMSFNAISRSGKVVDSGSVTRRKAK